MMRARFSFAFLALLACSAQAGIYKTVGPDGKVTYSDHPPVTSDSQHDLVEKSAPAQGAVAQPAPSADPAAVVRTLGDKRPYAGKVAGAALRRPGTQPVASVSTAPAATPAASSAAAPPNEPTTLEGAIIGVLGIEDIVRQAEGLCTKALPPSFGKYSQAAAQWRQRNHVVVMQAHHAIAQGFNAGDGADVEQRIETAIRAKNQGMFQSILQASTADKIRWCVNSVEEIQAGSMDFAGKTKLTEPLRGYR